ncbi:hypothetical protein TrRE_jg2821, partial [Triparma retinervis]
MATFSGSSSTSAVDPSHEVQVLQAPPPPPSVTLYDSDEGCEVVSKPQVQAREVIDYVFLIPLKQKEGMNPDKLPIPEPSAIKLLSKGSGIGVRDWIELNTNSWRDANNNVYRHSSNWPLPPKP